VKQKNAIVIRNRRPTITLRRLAAALLFFSVLSGCIRPPAKLVRDDYERRAAPIRAIGVLVPDISYYDVSFGGVREKNDALSAQARENVVNAAKSVLTARGFSVTVIPREGDRKESLEEIDGLFGEIAWTYRATVLSTRPIDVFPHKAASFDYSVGPVGDILDAHHVDALLLVEAGGAGNSIFVHGGTAILVTLVDRSGALLWYEPYVREGSGFTRMDITEPDDAREMIEAIFATMPTVTR
jgi:hypothetical protein